MVERLLTCEHCLLCFAVVPLSRKQSSNAVVGSQGRNTCLSFRQAALVAL